MPANKKDLLTTLLFVTSCLMEAASLAMAFWFSVRDRTSGTFWLCSAIYLHVSRPLLLRSMTELGDGRRR